MPTDISTTASALANGATATNLQAYHILMIATPGLLLP
jgi:hypothetical protein